MRICRTSALVGALLFMAGTGRAMAWQGPDLSLPRWESAWEWIASWFGQGVVARDMSSSQIDPNGVKTRSSSVQSKSSSSIDPDGLAASASAQSDSSAGIDPDGKH